MVGAGGGGLGRCWKLLDIAVDPNPVACIVLQFARSHRTVWGVGGGGGVQYRLKMIRGKKVLQVCVRCHAGGVHAVVTGVFRLGSKRRWGDHYEGRRIGHRGHRPSADCRVLFKCVGVFLHTTVKIIHWGWGSGGTEKQRF